MASPFEFSRRTAVIRTPTHNVSTLKLANAPQHNPYDKFTQPEFDAWIGGITGALKRALGQEDQMASHSDPGSQELDQSYSSDEEEVERLVELDIQSSDEEVEDCFLPSRRVSKGKARDPRDGPGFGKGGQDEPIVIGSDSEGEEDEEDEDVSDEWDEALQSEENHETTWVGAESSVQARIRHAWAVAETEEEGFEEEESEHSADDQDDWDVQQASSPVLVISDDEVEVEDSPVQQIHVIDEEDSAEEDSVEEDPSPPLYTSNRIGPPRGRAKRENPVPPRKDFGDVKEIEHVEEQGYEDAQPLEDDTSFPPHDIALDVEVEEHVEIRDPWSGPKTYAEDYYSGGDVVKEPQNMTADRLGENDEFPEIEERPLGKVEEASGDLKEVAEIEEDDVQPLDDDTSFPPHDINTTAEYVEIRDPWSGPKKYAEDFYSGGNIVGTPQNLNVDRIGENDEGLEEEQKQEEQRLEEQRVIDVDADDMDNVQPLSEDTSFPPRFDEDDHQQLTTEQPLEIPDQWANPKTYAEDYYSGGDVRPLQKGILNPHRLGDNDESVLSTPVPHPEAQIKAEEEVNVKEDTVHSGEQPPPNVTAPLPSDPTNESPQLDFFMALPDPWDAPINCDEEITIERYSHSPEQLDPPSGSGNNSNTAIIVVSENEADSVKGEDVREHAEERITSDHVEEPVHKDLDDRHSSTSSQAPPVTGQAVGLDFLYDDTQVVEDFEGPVLDNGRSDDLSGVIDWIYDPTLMDEVFANAMDKPILQASAPDTPVAGTRERSVESAQQVDDASAVMIDSRALSALQFRTSPPEEAVEAEILSVGTAEPIALAYDSLADMKTTASNISQIELDVQPTFLTSVESTESTRNAPSVEHSDRVEVDTFEIVVNDITVTPEIEEIEEIERKVDADADKELDVDFDPLSEVHKDDFTQDSVVEPIEVLEEDTTTPVGIVLDEDDSKISEFVPAPAPIESLQESEAPAAEEETLLHDDNDTHARDPDLQVILTSQAAPDSVPTLTPTVTPKPTDMDPVNPEHKHSVSVLSSVLLPILSSSNTKEQHPSSPPTAGHVASCVPEIPAASSEAEWFSRLPTVSAAPIPSPYDDPWRKVLMMHKTTDPILLADPYPASLSTPDDGPSMDKQDASTEESSFEESSQDNSLSSSSSLDQEREHNVENITTNGQDKDKAGNTELQYPRDGDLDEPTEADADGDVDLEYVKPSPTTHLSSPRLPATPVLESSVDIKGSNGFGATAVPDKAENCTDNASKVQSSRSATTIIFDNARSSICYLNSPLSSPVVERPNGGASAKRVRSHLLEDDLPSILIIKKVPADEQTPVKLKSGRLPKRKRSSSVTATLLPRSGSSKKLAKGKAPLRLPLKAQSSDSMVNRKSSSIDKGKGRELAGAPPVSQGSIDTWSISSRSSSNASAARHILNPGSGSTSRASSIASNAPSDNSFSAVQPSPSLGKGSLSRQPLPPPPLLHRHHHNRPGAARPALPVKPSVSARQVDTTSSDSPASKQIASSHRHPAYSSSPVTRSNCRYRKISIPLDDESDDEGSEGDEDVKLVYFLVPGCSLGNAELNRDEKIVDRGDVTPADRLVMTPDLDIYAFNAPLLSVLRLLVGVDMLREGEIYYLPLPDSDWVPRKAREPPSKVIYGLGESGPAYMSPRRNSNMPTIPLSAIVPASAPMSALTSASNRSLKPVSTISEASSELTEVEDSPQYKRLKPSPKEGEHPSLNFDDTSTNPSHVEQDASDRASDDDESINSLDGPVSPVYRLIRGSQPGLKRSRTSDVVRESDVDAQKLKKQKTGPDLRSN
ncbi:hypothetical protein C0991_011713 [Blastosporella zonata]|nr:hypothetical protein C0991_011713 [Blastosporella zonata]